MKIRDDDGQALLMAMAFLVFFGVVIAAILSFAEASVRATGQLRVQRTTVYAADGATDAAIQLGRAYPAVGALNAAPCMYTTGFSTQTPTLNGSVEARVYCTALQSIGPNGEVPVDRKVEFRACVDNKVVVVATVLYHDSLAPTGTPPPVDVLSWISSGATGACQDGP